MSDPVFGINIAVIDNEPRPAVTSNMSTIGLVGTAPDADANVYPLDTPVLVYSDDTDALASLGLAGTLYDAVNGINQQLSEFQVSAQIVVVRVDEGEDTFETIGNLVGSLNSRTGMYALLNSATLTGVIPRIIVVPGYTSQAINQVKPVLASLTAGSGYTAAPSVSFSGGGSDPNKRLPTATATISGGAVTGLVFSDLGANLLAAPTVAFSGGSGTGAAATLALDAYSNAVIAGLPTLLDRLLAVAFVDGPGSNDATAINWRTSISSKRIIPHDVPYKVQDEDGTIRTVPASPFLAGKQVAVDHEKSGIPSHVAANRAINGIVGVGRSIDFSITDGASQGQVLLEKNIGITVRGNFNDGAIADGGYVYIGTDTCSGDTLWTFYNQVRMRDYIHLLFIKTLRGYLGRFNLTGQTIQAVVNTMKFALRDLQADNRILGYNVGFTRAANSPENLRKGRFTVAFAAEEPAPLRRLDIQSSRYRPALDALLTDLLAQLDVTA